MSSLRIDVASPQPSLPEMSSASPREEFVRLLTQHQRRVYAYILGIVPNWNDADEILQETNIRLWSEFDRFELGTNFEAWAVRVAHFQILSWRKRVSRSRLFFDHSLVELIAQEFEAHNAMAEVRHQALRECVSALEPRQSELLARCYAEGAKIKHVAESLARTTASVHKALQRVRLSLHKCIRRRLAEEGMA
ncbi:MAG: RNA polymerase subunit sigma-70 [Pirellula sp.]|nr:RNA polymerase subunit sigma-70 [Pirellula sp.]